MQLEIKISIAWYRRSIVREKSLMEKKHFLPRFSLSPFRDPTII